ncbi:MAG: hypothetical protein R3A12_02395 [Ignavibacteria bacterium]
MHSATVSLERVQSILDTVETITEKENPVEPGNFKGGLISNTLHSPTNLILLSCLI